MKKRNTRADKLHFERLVEMGCIVCKIHLGVYTHPEIHHLRSGCGAGQRSDNHHTIPLCHPHHRTGGHGVAVHAGKQTWEKNFGTELELLEQVNNELGVLAKPDTSLKQLILQGTPTGSDKGDKNNA